MLYVNVTYTLPKANRDAFVADVLGQNIPALTRQEYGNHAYDFSVPVEHDDKVYLREIWEDDAFEIHKGSENIQKLVAMKDKYQIETSLVISRFD